MSPLRPWLPASLSLALLCLGAAAHAAEPADERQTAYRDFRVAFDSANYAQALPQAQRVVELTRAQYGEKAQQLVNPLTNLGTTYYRLKQYGPAMDSYRAALGLLDLETESANPRLIRPLFGLGVTLNAEERYEDAIVPLKRAVDITRNLEGLHAASQLPLMQPLVKAYMESGRREEAGRELQYALTVAETSYGHNDARLLAPMDELGRWNEEMGRFSMARAVHARAVQIADSVPDHQPLLAVPALRGIARTYRMAFVYGETEEAAAVATAATAQDSILQRAVVMPSSEGERALHAAIERLRAGQPVDSRTLGAVQTDLGDWFLTAGAPQRAMAAYRDAWNSLNAVGAAEPLATPAPLTYRAPSVAFSRGLEDADTHKLLDSELRLSVDAEGRVREAVATSPVPERDSADRAVIGALRRTLFRPAIVGGEAVASGSSLFHERVWVRLPDPDKPEKPKKP